MKRLLEGIRSMAVGAGEVALSLACVLVFFLLFMGILGVSFPQGTGLQDLLQFEEQMSGEAVSGLQIDFGVDQPQGPLAFVARLSEVSRKVKDKKPGAIAWADARQGADLRDRHAVQTFDRSGATISFGEGNRIRMLENSLVIVRRLEKARDQNQRRASLVILGGEMTAEINRSQDGSLDLDIVSAEAVATIRSADEERTNFRVRTNEDESTTYDVLLGSASVTANGKTVQIPQDYSVTVVPGEGPQAAVPLPRASVSRAPGDGTAVVYAGVPPEVDFRWEPGLGASQWQLQIARDEQFESVVFDELLEAPDFTHGNLPDGELFWRVRSRMGYARGPMSETRTLKLVEDVTPPALTVEVALSADGRVAVISGSTDVDAEVFVAKRQVDIDSDGSFSVEVELQRGLNRIVVEAFDTVGNVAYRTEQVTARF